MSGWFTLLPDVSTQGVACLWRATWQGSIGFLVVWLICGLVPRMPARFQCWLWRLALLKFVVVLLWRVPLGVPLLPAVMTPPSHITTSPATVSMVPRVIDAVPISSASNMADSQPFDPLAMLLTVLFFVWLIAVAWQAIRLVRGWMAMQHFRQRCRPPCLDEVAQHLRALCAKYGVRRPPLLLEQDGTGSPLLLGIFRPVVVMPSALLSAFGSEQYRMALAHELAHITRHDLAWSFVAALVRMVFVFHPLVWWASWRLDVSQEIAADEFVLTGFGKDSHSCTYAEMLLAVASQPQPGGMVPVLTVGTIGRYQTLKRRIAAMKSFHPTSRGVVVASAMLVGLIAALGIVPWRLVAAEAPQSAVPTADFVADNPYLYLPIYRPLADEDVRRMLHLSSQQEEKLRVIAAEFIPLTQLWSISQSASLGPATKQELEFQSISQSAPLGPTTKQGLEQKTKDLPKRIEQVLTAEQLVTLKHVMVQMAAARFVYSPSSGNAIGLNLNEQQKEALARLAKETKAARWPSRQEMRKKMLAVLTPEQREDLLAEVTGVSVSPALFSGPNGRASFAGYPDLVRLDIREKLDLSPQQQAKLDAITEKYAQMASKELPLSVRGLSGTASRAYAGQERNPQITREHDKMATMGSQMRAEIDAVLTPQQLSEFKRLSMEERTITWMTIPSVLEKLHASDQQKTELQRLAAESTKRDMTRASKSMRETGEKALQILDPQQRRNLAEQVDREIATSDTGKLRAVTSTMTFSASVVGVGAAEKSVTVFPIVINSGAPTPGVSADMSKNMAELVGLMLERGGMKEIEMADTKFIPPEKADLAKTAEAFAQFVKSQKLKTEYALFGQFFGMPGKGADEIRLAVVNQQGKVVLTDRLDRQQLLSRGATKIDPMLACSYAVDQLRAFWGLSNPSENNAPQGKMTKLWAEKSGLPPKAERDVMQARLKTLKQAIKTSTIVVFVRVSGKNDPKAAAALAAMLSHEDLGQAHAGKVDLTVTFKPNTNQLRVLWDAAHGFKDFLHTNPPSADYALLADYGVAHFPDGKTAVDGVDLIVCNRAGDWVWVDLQNDHHPEFQQINPHSPDDCNWLVIEVMKNELR